MNILNKNKKQIISKWIIFFLLTFVFCIDGFLLGYIYDDAQVDENYSHEHISYDFSEEDNSENILCSDHDSIQVLLVNSNYNLIDQNLICYQSTSINEYVDNLDSIYRSWVPPPGLYKPLVLIETTQLLI